MNHKRYLTLAGRIRQELSELERLVERVRLGWQRVKKTGDDFYVDSVALNLHGIYSGLERIFEMIAVHVDQARPEGPNWHQELLRQMAAEIPLVRPPVISTETRDSLDAYRGFRHVVRNIYAFNLDLLRIEHLVDQLPVVFDRVRDELLNFTALIEARSQGKD